MKVKLPHTLPQKVLGALSLLVLLLQFLLPLIFWSHLPDPMPTHYTAAGEIDGWGSRGTIFVMAGFSLFIWVFLGVVNLIDPRKWNIPFTVPWGREVPVYSAVKTMMAALRLETMLIFAAEELTMVLGKEDLMMPIVWSLCVLMFITIAAGLWIAWRQRFR